eukprot:m.33835 g.33835  ORF g.33835 m.33835 type:complete len:366 (-) comp8612_c0_seq1:86-1183(-)
MICISEKFSLVLHLLVFLFMDNVLGAGRVNPNWDTIWAYYNYPNGPPPFTVLNLETWKRHNPGMKIRLINESNIREYVPDLPEEFFRLPYDQCKSDVLRTAVIFHHGGLYLDTDFLVMKPLRKILSHLETNDIVSYTVDNGPKTASCVPSFSSNWHAGRKGNYVSQVWWNNIKTLLTRMCDPGDFRDEVDKVCCHEKGAPEKEAKKCHIPWAQLEHLKNPKEWAAKHSQDASHIQQLSQDPKLFCLEGDRSLTPHRHGQLYWMPWDRKRGITNTTGKWGIAKFRCNCTEEIGSGDLLCNASTVQDKPDKPPRVTNKGKRISNFFGRPAYHLYASTHLNKESWVTPQRILEHDWLLSELYRRSLRK